MGRDVIGNMTEFVEFATAILPLKSMVERIRYRETVQVLLKIDSGAAQCTARRAICLISAHAISIYQAMRNRRTLALMQDHASVEFNHLPDFLRKSVELIGQIRRSKDFANDA